MVYRDEAGLDRRARLVESLSRSGLDDASRQEIETEIAVGDRERRAAARLHLPLVAQAKIASPCPEIWETMQGEGAVRACSRCDQEVFDLGAMTLMEADTLIRDRVGQRTCIRLHRRTDGTMMFADCEVGASGVRTRRIGVALASLAIGASAAASMATLDEPYRDTGHGRTFVAVDDPYYAHLPSLAQPEMMMGEMMAMPVPSEAADSPPLGSPGYILTSPPRHGR